MAHPTNVARATQDTLRVRALRLGTERHIRSALPRSARFRSGELIVADVRGLDRARLLRIDVDLLVARIGGRDRGTFVVRPVPEEPAALVRPEPRIPAGA